MPETLAALLLAHTLADFVFQTNWMVAQKRKPAAIAVHIAVVLVAAIALTGSLHPALFALALAHLVIDMAKTWLPWRGVGPFLADQAAHLISLVIVAVLLPDLWANGLWANVAGGLSAGGAGAGSAWLQPLLPDPAPLPATMVLIAGFLIATRAGGFAVGLYMAPWAEASPKGLPGGGRAIGLLERALIFLLILTGQAAGIGFLIAAKSVLRFGAVGDDRAVSEYVIIGTLASFGWAMAVAFATVAFLGQLPPLPFASLAP
jgi:hypothetical protein